MLQTGIKNLKIKPLTKEQLIISVDRLTRFKDTETKYLRVFKDIIINNLIEPKLKKQELDNMDYQELTELAESVINSSFPDKMMICLSTKDFMIMRILYSDLMKIRRTF